MKNETLRVVNEYEMTSLEIDATRMSEIWERGDSLFAVYKNDTGFYLDETPRNTNYLRSAEKITKKKALSLLSKYGAAK